jgi:hypothetical protein
MRISLRVCLIVIGKEERKEKMKQLREWMAGGGGGGGGGGGETDGIWEESGSGLNLQLGKGNWYSLDQVPTSSHLVKTGADT